jgi:hypothetical protein
MPFGNTSNQQQQ